MMINCYKLIPWSHFFFLSYLWEIERVNWMRTDLILWEMFSAVEYICRPSGRFPHHLWVESLNNYQNRKAMCQSKSNFLFLSFCFGTMLQHMLEERLVDGFSVLKFWFFHPSSSQCPISEDWNIKGPNTNICTYSRTTTFLVTHVPVTNLQNPDPPVYLWPFHYPHEFSLLLGLDSVLKVLDHFLQKVDFWPKLACLVTSVRVFAKPCVFVWLPLPLAQNRLVVRASLGLSQSKSQPSSRPRQSWVCLRT